MRKILLALLIGISLIGNAQQVILIPSGTPASSNNKFNAAVPVTNKATYIIISTNTLFNGTSGTMTLQGSNDGATYVDDGTQSPLTLNTGTNTYTWTITSSYGWYGITYAKGNATKGTIASTMSYSTTNGTVTSVTVTPNAGITATVTNAATTPSINLSLGAITPTTVNGNIIATGTGKLDLSTYSLTATATGNVLINGGALGTPSSGVATNLTGTASGLTTGNVTTNANLTGPIISVGNATSIASQTGTGSTFVTQASPTLTTPNIGTPSAGILTNCTGLPVAGSGTGKTSFTAYSIICGGTTSTGAFQNVIGLGTIGQIIRSNGSGALPSWVTDPALSLTLSQILVNGSDGGGNSISNISSLVDGQGSPQEAINITSRTLSNLSGSNTLNFDTRTLSGNWVLGTPASGTLTNCTLPIGGVTGLGTGIATFLATPSSANLASALTDEIGSGNVIMSDLSINAQTASYTLVLGDKYKLVTMNVSSTNTLTVPTNASVAYPTGSIIQICQIGAGQTIVVAAGGVTINSANSGLNLIKYSIARLVKTGTDTWLLSGQSLDNSTGGTITYSGGYTIHTFTSSGTFTPSTLLGVDYLLVAGGGGGGGEDAGGGGGGGLITGSDALPAGSYAVTVGAGGAGASGANAVGTTGSNSVYNSHTANGGGGGGAYSATVGAAGGCGGGGGAAAAAGTAGGTGSQGFNGGVGGGQTIYRGGGGGGMGASGVSGASGGTGGAGLANSYSGTSVTYAGGGGGGAATTSAGAGGAGGGGAGVFGSSGNATSGTANTGGGGGGGCDNASSVGGTGASGVAILRYLSF